MELFTKTQIEQLYRNYNDPNPRKDHPPVVKLFMTNSACTWLISELNPEYPDIAFGLCDLGMGFPELGYVSIDELKEEQDFLRRLERDISFKGNYPLSAYSRAARETSCIVTDDASLKLAMR